MINNLEFIFLPVSLDMERARIIALEIYMYRHVHKCRLVCRQLFVQNLIWSSGNGTLSGEKLHCSWVILNVYPTVNGLFEHGNITKTKYQHWLRQSSFFITQLFFTNLFGTSLTYSVNYAPYFLLWEDSFVITRAQAENNTIVLN